MHTKVRAIPTLPAADLERARRFYEDKLGFQMEEKGPDGYTFRVGDESSIYVYETQAPRGGNTAVSFEVGDFDAEVKELREKGITFEQYDMPDVKWHEGVADYGGMRTFWFKDTEGNILNVSEWKSMEKRGRMAA